MAIVQKFLVAHTCAALICMSIWTICVKLFLTCHRHLPTCSNRQASCTIDLYNIGRCRLDAGVAAQI